MFTHIINQTVVSNRKLHRETLHEITSAYREIGRDRVC